MTVSRKRRLERARTFCKWRLLALLRLRIALYSREQTSEKIGAGMSVSRFGDGEFGLALFSRGIPFQRYDPHLAQRLRQVLAARVPGLLVCLPGPLKSLKGMDAASTAYWKKWLLHNGRTVLSALPAPRRRYGDAGVSRLYLGRADKSREATIVRNICSAWQDKDVVVVEGCLTRFGVGNDLLDGCRRVRRILCPAKDAFGAYEEIYRACLEARGEVYVIALGPTATVLAHDLCRSGLVAQDLGHMDIQYEYMLRKSEQKHRIPGKYNNEVEGGDQVEECLDEAYQRQIIRRVSC